MQQIYLSDSGPKVSAAVYSFYRWEGDTKDVARDSMESTIDLCLSLGINTFDLADYYYNHVCEDLFGEIIAKKKYKREDLVLFTKCGVRLPHPSQPDVKIRYIDTSAKHIKQSIDKSLKKLNTDYIDIFLLDHLDSISNLEETAHALEQALKSGKIRHIGVANFSVFQHQLLSSYLQSAVVTHHLELNLLNTSAIKNGQLDYIKQRYIRALAAAPLAGGKIAYGNDEISVKLRNKLQALAPKYNKDIESIAVAWLIKLGALPLIGTKEERRIRNVVAAFDIQLEHQDWYDLLQAAD
jgi:predicted oxidoreductase